MYAIHTDAGKENFLNYKQMNYVDSILAWYEMGQNITRWTLENKNVQNFLKTNQHFDVIVIEVFGQESLFGLMHHFNAPLIGVSAFGASHLTTDLVGSPNFASYVPHTITSYSDRMSFSERLQNSLYFWAEMFLFPRYHLSIQQQMMEKYFPNTTNWPSLEQMRKNVSLVLLNTHVTYGTPRPYAPNMIEVGGMQIRQNIEPLPKSIQTFLDEARNGAIFLSLGTNVNLTKLPQHKLQAIQNAFSDHPNIRILIKSDEKIAIPSHKVEDVLIEPWFNQQSILAHPNIKLFVTHGGLLSTTGKLK